MGSGYVFVIEYVQGMVRVSGYETSSPIRIDQRALFNGQNMSRRYHSYPLLHHPHNHENVVDFLLVHDD